jgi:hypothetical protein
LPRSGPVSRSFTATSPAAHRAPASAAAARILQPPPSNAPTGQYRQHHDIVAPQIDATSFRPGWLVETRVYALFQAGRIDRAALDAAIRWRRWAETVAPSKVQAGEYRVDTSIGPGDSGMAHRMDAAGRLREAAAALGALRVAILEACVLKDHSWLELGRLLRVSDKTARDRAAEAIIALAAWRAGEAVPSPPELRFRNQPGSW